MIALATPCKLVLICCWKPIGANSILTLELISGIQLAQDLPNGEGSSAVIHTHRQPHPFKLRASESCAGVTATTHMVLPREGLGKLPQTSRSIALRSATCLTPSPLLFPPSPHTDTGCRIVKVWGCAPLLLHPTWRSAFPLSFLYNPINDAGHSLRLDDSQVHDNELPGRLRSRLSILSFLHPGKLQH